MKAQPAAIGARNFLSFSEEGHEQQKDEVSIDLRLQFQISREILRADFAAANLELQRGVQRMIDFLHEHDERTDVAIAQAGARIMALELFDQPARIINADVELIVRGAKKSPCQFAQLARRGAGQSRELPATSLIDQAIFKINADLRISALEKPLNLTEKRLVHK